MGKKCSKALVHLSAAAVMYRCKRVEHYIMASLINLYKTCDDRSLFDAFPLFIFGGDIAFGLMEIEEFFVSRIIVIDFEKSRGNFLNDTLVESTANCPYVIHERRRRPKDNHFVGVDFLRANQFIPHQKVEGSGIKSPGLYPGGGGVMGSAKAEVRKVLLRVDSSFEQIKTRHQMPRC